MFTKFTDIESFSSVVKLSEKYPHLVPGPITFRAKIKLHGTSSAVRITRDGVVAQSRNRDITPEDDNAGFARWVKQNEEYFQKLSSDTWNGININWNKVVIYGEWCGPGIMGGTAINQIPNKIFAVFMFLVDERPFISPEFITKFLTGYDGPKIDLPSDIKVLPWYGEEHKVDFTNHECLVNLADKVNKIVNEIELCDPWVKEEFGVEGVCEGLVYYPYLETGTSSKLFGDFVFKVKGERHKEVKTKTAIQLDPEIAQSIEDFAQMFVTDARMEKAIDFVGGVDITKTGQILKWMNEDIIKESKDELEASNMEWSQVQKAVSQLARKKYIEECNRI